MTIPHMRLQWGISFAERERFELSVEVYPLRRFSKPLVSATHPPLRVLVEIITTAPRYETMPRNATTGIGLRCPVKQNRPLQDHAVRAVRSQIVGFGPSRSVDRDEISSRLWRDGPLTHLSGSLAELQLNRKIQILPSGRNRRRAPPSMLMLAMRVDPLRPVH